MSPEQAAGEADIDIRTDIYALGAILYELLTLHDAAYEEMRSIIRRKPSARIPPAEATTIATRGRGKVMRLSQRGARSSLPAAQGRAHGLASEARRDKSLE